MLIIGSHVSFGKEQMLGALKEALSYGANTFMFYTGAPTNTIRKSINHDKVVEAKKMMLENAIDITHVICHAPYIVNLVCNIDLDKYQFSIDFIRNELKRCDEMGITKMVLHPGNAVGIIKQEGLDNIVEALNQILDGSMQCRILLETMAGKGSECGSTIDEMKYIIDSVKNKEQIGVCVDTCHISDAGYAINHFEEYLDEFDVKIGIDKIGCIHVNDSKNIVGSHKDRHANIGMGMIGFENLCSVIYHEKLENVPKILETPYIGDTDEAKERLYPPYKYEIEMIRNKEFDEMFLEKIRNAYRK